MTINIPALEEELNKQNLPIKIISIHFYSSSLFPLYKCTAISNGQQIQLAMKLIDNKIMAESEAKSLQHLRSLNVRCPEPFALIQQENYHGLLMSFVQHKAVNHTKIKLDLKQSLANLYSEPSSQFGYTNTNFVGTIEQSNQLYNSFFEFWWHSRIERMLLLCQKQGYLKDISIAKLKSTIDASVKNLSLHQETPHLVHGDLWNGNILFSGDYAFLIDPSIAYSLPEQDFAMLELFGSPLDLTDYQSLRPGISIDLLKQRIQFFQLYPLLVHVSLFGGSYIQSSRQLIKQLS